VVERVTRIELALSAWESDRTTPLAGLTWRYECPLVTLADPWLPGLMARQWPGDLASQGRSDLLLRRSFRLQRWPVIGCCILTPCTLQWMARVRSVRGSQDVTGVWDSGLVTDSRDSLLNSLVAAAMAVHEALPQPVSSPGLEPPTTGLDWRAGVALQHILDAGIDAEDVLALVRQVRVRAITDAIAVIDQGGSWAICDLVDGVHEPLGGLDSELWFLANLQR
jgi:hypothetical protein